MVLVFVTCRNKKEAEKIGLALLKKRLAACFVVVPEVFSAYRWRGKVEKTQEAVLLVKTLPKKFPALEREVKRLHSYSIPFIAAISPRRVNQDYLTWLKKEVT